jgi:hypothetical protein
MTNNWTLPLIINLISAVVFFILGIISKNVLDIFRKKKPVDNFWNKCLRSSTNIVISSLPANYHEFSLYTGYSDLKASARIASLLPSFHKDPERIKMLEARYASDRLRENVILIGGPIGNELTKRVMKDFEIPFSFVDHTLLDKYHNKKYEAKLGEDGDVLEDYALILRIKNPYNSQKNLFLVAGCYGYGTYSGAEAVPSLS